MEEESDENDYSCSNKIIKKRAHKFMLSDLSISDDPIPLLINPIKRKNEEKNINNKYKEKKWKKEKKFAKYCLKQNIQKYNSSPEKYNIIIINNLINLKENSLVAIFKDNLITCNENEFLRGNFNIKECIEVLPKFYDYYKNYLMFFC